MWPFGMWVAQKGGDVFWVGFMDETHEEQYFSSPSSSSSQLSYTVDFLPSIFVYRLSGKKIV